MHMIFSLYIEKELSLFRKVSKLETKINGKKVTVHIQCISITFSLLPELRDELQTMKTGAESESKDQNPIY